MSLKGNLEQERQDFRTQSEKIKKSVQEAGEQIKRNSTDAWNDFIEVIRRHPGKAVGVALAAGVAVGTAATALSNKRTTSTVGKLRDLKDTGNEAWEALRKGFNEAICTLKDTVDEAASKFK